MSVPPGKFLSAARLITGFHSKEKNLHDAARKLDGKNVVLLGRGMPCIEFRTGSQDYEIGVKFCVTNIRAAKDRK
jgi:hypothetical protein